MKARILDNIDQVMVNEDGKDALHDHEYIKLRDRIKGKVVSLTFCHGDAFEEIDNNIWLPPGCYEILD